MAALLMCDYREFLSRFFTSRRYGAEVSTRDFDSLDLGSNPSIAWTSFLLIGQRTTVSLSQHLE